MRKELILDAIQQRLPGFEIPLDFAQRTSFLSLPTIFSITTEEDVVSFYKGIAAKLRVGDQYRYCLCDELVTLTVMITPAGIQRNSILSLYE